MLEDAKQDLKNRIITENSEEFYYKLIAERVKKFNEFKLAGDFVFGEMDDDEFREEVIKTTLENNENLSQEQQLYELVMTENALDVFLKIKYF